MFELIKSLLFACLMVPVVMAVIIGAIYILAEVFNVISKVGHSYSSNNKKLPNNKTSQ